jgi:hypothetical protein
LRLDAALSFRDSGGFMRPWVFLTFAALGCAAPRNRGDDLATVAEQGRPVRNEALRRELLARLDADQAVRLALIRKQQHGLPPDSLDVARVAAVDSGNTAWLERVIAARGWPGRTLVGADGANAAFALVQHARDTAFQAQVLRLLVRAQAAGEVEGQHLALLTDRVAVTRGQPQVYGTQATIVNGRVVLARLADSSGVDARRQRVGLPPLAAYLRVLDSLYAARPRP